MKGNIKSNEYVILKKLIGFEMAITVLRFMTELHFRINRTAAYDRHKVCEPNMVPEYRVYLWARKERCMMFVNRNCLRIHIPLDSLRMMKMCAWNPYNMDDLSKLITHESLHITLHVYESAQASAALDHMDIGW